MGKRKSSAKAAPKKKQEPLSTTFNCLFCHHEKTVVVKLDKVYSKGSLRCKDCGQEYETKISPLSVHVDVYSDWIDACEEVKDRAPARAQPLRYPDPLAHGSAGGAGLTMQSDLAKKSKQSGEGLLDADKDEDDEADYDAPPPRSNGKDRKGRDRERERSRRDRDDEDEEEEAEDVYERDEDDADRRRKARRNDPDEDSD